MEQPLSQQDEQEINSVFCEADGDDSGLLDIIEIKECIMDTLSKGKLN
jgi:hypothetical protein